jgi:hypothetical protein
VFVAFFAATNSNYRFPNIRRLVLSYVPDVNGSYDPVVVHSISRQLPFPEARRLMHCALLASEGSFFLVAQNS